MRTWTTNGLPEADQFSYWREVLCEAFTSMAPDADDRTSFPSVVSQHELGDILVSDAAAPAQRLTRGAREIRQSPTPSFFVNFQLEGTCLCWQDGRSVLARPGDFYLVDSTRCFKQEYTAWRALTLYIPRHMLAPLLAAPSRATAVRVPTHGSGVGALAWTIVQSIRGVAGELDRGARELLGASLVNVLAVALGATAEAQAMGRPALGHGLLRAIQAHVVRNACDPSLSVAAVAQQFQISPRYLHKLFEQADETFTQLVLKERLQHCARMLRTRGRDASIASIAFAAGFGDLSNFGRAFRRHYGTSPRDYRNAGCRDGGEDTGYGA